MKVEVSKDNELAVPRNEDLQNRGKLFKELSSRRRGTGSVDRED